MKRQAVAMDGSLVWIAWLPSHSGAATPTSQGPALREPKTAAAIRHDRISLETERGVWVNSDLF